MVLNHCLPVLTMVLAMINPCVQHRSVKKRCVTRVISEAEQIALQIAGFRSEAGPAGATTATVTATVHSG